MNNYSILDGFKVGDKVVIKHQPKVCTIMYLHKKLFSSNTCELIYMNDKENFTTMTGVQILTLSKEVI